MLFVKKGIIKRYNPIAKLLVKKEMNIEFCIIDRVLFPLAINVFNVVGSPACTKVIKKSIVLVDNVYNSMVWLSMDLANWILILNDNSFAIKDMMNNKMVDWISFVFIDSPNLLYVF